MTTSQPEAVVDSCTYKLAAVFIRCSEEQRCALQLRANTASFMESISFVGRKQ